MPWTKTLPEIRTQDASPSTPGEERPLAYTEAIREALDQALEMDPRVFVMGQGVDDGTGMFGTTKYLHKRHGHHRCFDTALAEASLTGIAMGASLGDMRPVHMHNRPDFLFLCMDQLINHASKWHYMFGGSVHVPMVVWACIGRGWGSGAQHSQALQGTLMHFPGLKLVMPSTPFDAKGLMLSAIADPGPVVVLEHRHNFRYTGHVPREPYRLPIGKGVIRRTGSDVTVAGVSNMILEAQTAADELAADGIDVEVVDLRSLRPLDESLLLDSVRKTGRLVVVDSGWITGGVAAEIAALAAEKAFDALKAPVRRVACPDVPTPSGYTLEQAFYPGKQEIVDAIRAAITK